MYVYVCVRVYVYIHIYLHMFTYVYTYVYVVQYIYIYIYVYIDAYTCIYASAYLCVCVCVCVARLHFTGKKPYIHTNRAVHFVPSPSKEEKLHKRDLQSEWTVRGSDVLYLHFPNRCNFSKETWKRDLQKRPINIKMYKRVLFMYQKIRTSCAFIFKTGVTSQKRPTKETYKQRDEQKSPIHISEDPYILYIHL